MKVKRDCARKKQCFSCLNRAATRFQLGKILFKLFKGRYPTPRPSMRKNKKLGSLRCSHLGCAVWKTKTLIQFIIAENLTVSWKRISLKLRAAGKAFLHRDQSRVGICCKVEVKERMGSIAIGRRVESEISKTY
jgi:hypothetical protein